MNLMDKLIEKEEKFRNLRGGIFLEEFEELKLNVEKIMNKVNLNMAINHGAYYIEFIDFVSKELIDSVNRYHYPRINEKVFLPALKENFLVVDIIHSFNEIDSEIIADVVRIYVKKVID